ncbi:hypothetical protein [Actinomyces sp. Marseille-P3109]|uniref:hypothetical protein n=1 Tax=Actinomyces sp. Marseille-P3109 TaxID=2083009 RepID=UPI000D55D972|nr:hypothetical protein [Actinomyces sp. Marseille-P3109]
MSVKPSKNTADKAENKTAEKIDSGATQEAGAEEIVGQPAAVSGSPKPRSAAGVASRLHVIFDAGADRGRRAVERVVESRLGSWWTSTERPSFVDWALLGVILLGAYAFFLYGDVRATFEHSFNFLDSVFQGRVGDFYQIAIEHTTTGHPAVYDVSLYLLFGLWNLPTYIIYRITGFDYFLSTPAQLWLKTMMVVAALAAAKMLVDIARDLGVGRQRSKWVAFFFLSSMTLFVPVFVIVQYDIIMILFILLGLRAYMRGQLGRFLLWFAIANTLKLFAIFIFVPLLLLREKRLRVVALQLVVGLIGLVGCRALYHGNVAYEASTGGFMSSMLQRLTAVGIPWLGSMIPIFVVFMVGIVIFTYLRRPQGPKALAADAVYICMAVYLVFTTVVPLNPYWAVMVSPFAVLIIFLNPRHMLLNTLLETGVGTSVFLMYTFSGYSMYDRNIFAQLLLPHLIAPTAQPRYETPAQFLEAMGVARQGSFIVGFMIACALAILIINFPRNEMVENLGKGERVPRSVAWMRLLMPAGFSALVMIPYFVPAVPVAYSASTDAPEAGSVNILEDRASVAETIILPSTVEVSSINIAFLADEVPWIDSSVVNIAVTDASGNQVFRTEAPANSLHTGLHTFPAEGLVLRGGEKYTVTITSEMTEGGKARVMMNPSVDQFPTTENGNTVGGDLLMSISGRTK